MQTTAVVHRYISTAVSLLHFINLFPSPFQASSLFSISNHLLLNFTDLLLLLYPIDLPLLQFRQLPGPRHHQLKSLYLND
jgi:hypothetical protein